MLETLGEANTAASIGLLGGIALGLAARVGRFCTLGAIEDYLYSSDDRRLRMWAVAIGISIITTQFAMSSGNFDPAQSAYLDRVWNPIATVIGGLMFGYGMSLSGNCGYGALARLGGGDIRSFLIVIVMGLSAYFVMLGPLAETRVWLFPVETNSSSPQGFTQLLNQIFDAPSYFIGLIFGCPILIWGLSNKAMFNSPKMIFWGAVVGIAIFSGWWGIYWISEIGFSAEPIETHSFAAPIGDTIFYSMTASGNSLSFSVGSVLGVVIGAFLGSFPKGQFRWEAC